MGSCGGLLVKTGQCHDETGMFCISSFTNLLDAGVDNILLSLRAMLLAVQRSFYARAVRTDAKLFVHSRIGGHMN